MRISTVSSIATIVAVLGFASAEASGAEACDGVGIAKFVCLSEDAEDVAHIPNSDWVVISGELRAEGRDEGGGFVSYRFRCTDGE